jgi:hypothetical protein
MRIEHLDIRTHQRKMPMKPTVGLPIWSLTTLGVALLMVGCGPKEANDGTPAPPPVSAPAPPQPLAGKPAEEASTYPGTEDGVKTLLAEFAKPGADHAALTKPLRPTKADLEAIFEADLAAKADVMYGPVWDSGQLVVAPKPGQTEVKIASATSEEINSGVGTATELPGGWREVAGKMKPGVRIYRFKFVEPGKGSGMAFDGLVYVNGNWRIVPKPWRAL